MFTSFSSPLCRMRVRMEGARALTGLNGFGLARGAEGSTTASVSCSHRLFLLTSALGVNVDVDIFQIHQRTSWSASPYAPDAGLAWYVGFNAGFGAAGGKGDNSPMRLVRGGQYSLSSVALAGLASNGTIWYTTNLSAWTQIPGQLSQLRIAHHQR